MAKVFDDRALVDTHQELPERDRFVVIYAPTAWWESVKDAEMPLSAEEMLNALGLDYRVSTDDEGEPSFYVYGQHVARGEES